MALMDQGFKALTIPDLSDDEIAKFWKNVLKSVESDGCWLWTAGVNDSGYGTIHFKERTLRAHRVAFALSGGILEPGKLVTHGPCGNRKCCRPSHLSAGNHLINARDRVRDGTNNSGSRNGFSKLKESEVSDMRDQWSKGVSQKEIATRYQVCQSSVSRIVNFKKWK